MQQTTVKERLEEYGLEESQLTKEQMATLVEEVKQINRGYTLLDSVLDSVNPYKGKF